MSDWGYCLDYEALAQSSVDMGDMPEWQRLACVLYVRLMLDYPEDQVKDVEQTIRWKYPTTCSSTHPYCWHIYLQNAQVG